MSPEILQTMSGKFTTNTPQLIEPINFERELYMRKTTEGDMAEEIMKQIKNEQVLYKQCIL